MPPAAIKATFSDLRIVKGRKVIQMVFEAPIEEADNALNALGGVPRGDSERWVAIARLDVGKLASEAPARAEKTTRKFDELPLSQQAALLCEREAFKRFLIERYDATQAEDSASAMREILCISSRSVLDKDQHAASVFRNLQSEFNAWLDEEPF